MMNTPLPTRKRTRLEQYDYSTPGAYFITICTHERKNVLSKIVGGDVLDAPPQIRLSPYGEIAEKYLNQLGAFYDNISVERYVIMPNHIHILLFIYDCGASRTSPNSGASRTSPPTRQHATLSRFVSTFKRFCNKEYGCNIWQRHFHDHIIRDRFDFEEHARYIRDNPARWFYDELYRAE